MPPGYSARFGVDHAGDDLTFIPRSQVALAEACFSNPECGSFSTLGQLQFAVPDEISVQIAAPNHCLYLKKKLKWSYRVFKNFQYSCVVAGSLATYAAFEDVSKPSGSAANSIFSVLTVTNVTGPIIPNSTPSSVPFQSYCAELSCCKSLCDYGLTECWSYAFGSGLSWCNNGGPCCQTIGYVIVNGQITQSQTYNGLTNAPNTRRCYSDRDIDFNKFTFHRNLTSYVKYFVGETPPVGFQYLSIKTNSSYPSVQGEILMPKKLLLHS